MLEACTSLVWDSKSGLITGIVDGVKRPINYSGQGISYIPITATTINYSIGGGTIEY